MNDLNPIQWAVRPLRRYADFTGRAPRAEYWWFSLAAGIVGFPLDYLDGLFGAPIVGIYGPIGLAYTLAILIPGFSVTVRRLHDIDRSGWWILLNVGTYVFTVAGFVVSDFGRIFELFRNLSPPILLVLILGWIAAIVVSFVFMITRGDEGPNRFGSDPYGADGLEEVFA